MSLLAEHDLYADSDANDVQTGNYGKASSMAKIPHCSSTKIILTCKWWYEVKEKMYQAKESGSNCSLCIYSGRMWGTQDQDYMLAQVCDRIERYANYGVPVASKPLSRSPSRQLK
jgi:hypothetical protein